MSAALAIDLSNSITSTTILHFPHTRRCKDCGGNIPQKRLQAMPNTTRCVPCLVQAGDVKRIRRFDDMAADGSCSQVYFTDSAEIEQRIARTLGITGQLLNVVEDEQDATAMDSSYGLSDAIYQQGVANQLDREHQD